MIAIIKRPDNGISVLYPIDEALSMYNLYEIALKDVPEGFPFWIVDESELPEDDLFRDAWEIPEGYREPDGYGSPFGTFEEIGNANN